MLPRPVDEIRMAERKVTEDLAFDQELFEELRVIRHAIDDEQDTAAFIVFGDRSLREMAAYYPQTIDAFRKIYGVSDKKLEQYGGRFLAAIQSYAERHGKQEQEIPGIDRVEQKLKRERAVQRKGSTFEETKMLLIQKLPISEIARIRGLKESTITQHVEDLATADPSMDVDYLRPTPELFDPIAAAFALHGTEALGPVFGHCKAMYTFDLLRLVRLFLRLSLIHI